MKKTIHSIALCLLLLLSACLQAFAVDTTVGEASHAVIGNHGGVAESEPVYSVDIVWGSLAFTYEVSDKTWDPDSHRYEGEGETHRWVCETDGDETTVDANEIRVINRSNAAVDVTVTAHMGDSGITATVSDQGHFTLNSADATITPENPVGTETKGSVTIALSGELSSDHEIGGEIGTVTVVLETARSAAESTDLLPDDTGNQK